MVENKYNVHGNLARICSSQFLRSLNYLFSLFFILFLTACNPTNEKLNEITGQAIATATPAPAAASIILLPSVGNNQTINGSINNSVNFTVNTGTDPNSGTLYYIKSSSPTTGTVTNCMDFVGTDGATDRTCTFTPPAAWTGSTSFQYKVNNGFNDSPTFATITINISGTNLSPSLNAIANQTITAGGAIAAINGTDVNGGDNDIDGQALLFTCTFSGGGFPAGSSCGSYLPGTTSFNQSTGILNWTSTFATAVSNLQTVYTFTISASDQQASPLSDSKTFTVTVNPAPPVMSTIADKLYPTNHVVQGTNTTFDVNNIRAGSPGNDNDMTYTCTFDTVVDGAVAGGAANCTTLPNSVFSFNTTTGAFSWTPNTSAVGTYEVKVTGTDSAAQSGSEISVIDVRLNFSGVTSISNVTTTTAQVNWTVPVGAISYDVYRVNGNGTLTYLASQSNGAASSLVVTGLTANTTYTFRVRANDVYGNVDGNQVNASATLGSTGTFSIPTLTANENINAQTANLNCTDIYANVPSYVLTNQTDTDSNCSLTATTGAAVKVSCTPAYKTGHGAWSSTVSVQCDLNGTFYTASFSVNVSDTNRAPSIGNISNQTVAENSAISAVNPVEVLGTSATDDTDIDGDALAYSCTFSGGGFAAGTDCATSLPGTFAMNSATGVLTFTAGYGAAVSEANTTYTLSVIGSDQQGAPLTGTTTFAITVTNLNRAPVLGVIANQTVAEGSGIASINTVETQGASAVDDLDADGNALAYSCTFSGGGNAAGTACSSLPGSVTFTTSTGALDWTPSYTAAVAGANTVYSISIVGSDQNSTPLTATTSFSVTVTNTSVSFTAVPTLNTTENTTSSSAILACDDGSGGNPTFTITSETDAASNCALTGGPIYVVQCTPSYKTGHATWTSDITVSCALNNSSTSRTFTVSVADTNRAPSLGALSNQSVSATSAITAVNAVEILGASATDDIDIDGDSLAYTCTFAGGGFSAGTACSSLPSNSYSFSTTQGALSWTPSSGAAPLTNTAYTFTYVGSDAQTSPLTSTTTFAITVNTTNKLTMSGSSVMAASCASITLNSKDVLDNAYNVPSAITVTIGGKGSASLYSDNTCTTPLTNPQITTGSAITTFYLKDTVAETLSLTADNGNLTQGTLSLAITANDADYLGIIAGNNQSGTGHALAATNLKVRAYDRYGNPKSGVQVAFTTMRGDGYAITPFVTTDSSGYASTQYRYSATDVVNKIEVTRVGTVLPDLAASGNARVLFTETTANTATSKRFFGRSATAVGPYGGKFKDLNGDGKKDYVTTNLTGNNLSVFMGFGDGTFAPAVSYSTGTGPRELELEDVDNDGKVDAIYLNNTSGTFSVRKGNGTGAFTTAASITLTASPMAISMGLFNNDAFLDVAITNNINTNMEIFLNNGDGTFSAGATLNTGFTQHRGSVATDLNNDGKTDLVDTAYNGAVINVFMGNGDGTFAARVAYACPANPMDVQAADLNSDGKMDVVVSTWATDRVSVYLGNGDGTLQTRTEYLTGANPTAIAISDYNNDGIKDLAVYAYTGKVITTYRGLGNGNFVSRSDLSTNETSYYSLVWEDLNGDGYKDFIFGSYANAEVISYFGNGTTSYIGKYRNLTTDAGAHDLVIGDFDVDGKADLANTNYTDSDVTVFIGMGNSNFNTRTGYVAGANPRVIKRGDFNGDGYLDLVFTNYTDNTFSYLQGAGDGTFAAKVDFTTGTNPYGIAVADFNRDGKLDVVTTNYATATSTISVFIGNGAGSFATKVDYAANTNPRHIAIGDFNGDKYPDIAVSDYGAAKMSVFINQGNGTFAAKSDFTTGSNPTSIESGDFNRDGNLDLLVFNYTSITASFFAGNGAGSFAAKSDTPLTGLSSIYGGTIADMNGDGFLDILAAGYGTTSLGINYGNGDGTFQTIVTYDVFAAFFNSAVSDFNGDGKMDLAIPNYGGAVNSIFTGQ